MTDRHLTTRRGFIATAGFGGTALYGLWAHYGAAPVPFAHDDHTAPAANAVNDLASPGVAAFEEEVRAFIDRHGQPDGSVFPRAPAHAHAHAHHGGPAEAPLAVPLLAARWFYEPAHLRLEAGRPYRFRMMATDVAHGASMQFGRGGRMIRLRPGQLVEQELTFRAPGELRVLCTLYCGTGHDAMQARISVVEGGGA